MARQLGLSNYSQLSLFSPMPQRRTLDALAVPLPYWAGASGGRSGGGGRAGRGMPVQERREAEAYPFKRSKFTFATPMNLGHPN